MIITVDLEKESAESLRTAKELIQEALERKEGLSSVPTAKELRPKPSPVQTFEMPEATPEPSKEKPKKSKRAILDEEIQSLDDDKDNKGTGIQVY